MGIARPFVAVAVVGVVAWVGYAELAERVPLPAALSLPLPGLDRAGDEAPTPADGGIADRTASPEGSFASALHAAAEQAGDLVRLGETKSRNLPQILDEQGRMTARLDEVDALVAVGALPQDAAEAVAAYESGARAVREAMDRAQAGLLRLDFGAVREATARMREGERDLARAARLASE